MIYLLCAEFNGQEGQGIALEITEDESEKEKWVDEYQGEGYDSHFYIELPPATITKILKKFPSGEKTSENSQN